VVLRAEPERQTEYTLNGTAVGVDIVRAPYGAHTDVVEFVAEDRVVTAGDKQCEGVGDEEIQTEFKIECDVVVA